MPSFCCPFGLGPKPAMTRPFTGQRKLGVPSLDLATTGVGVSSLGVTTAACCEPSTLGAGVALAGVALGAALAVDGAANGCAALGAALPAGGLLAAVALPPGMTMRSPIFSVAVGSMLLALASSATE